MQVDEGIPPLAGGTPLPVEDYAYNEEGNRTASHLSAIYASNDHNQLLEDEDFTYAYDAKGNRVAKTSKADGSVETYTYDSQNRLVGYASGMTTASYAYDVLERRIAKAVDSSQRAYIYDLSPSDPMAYDDIILEFEIDGLPILSRRWAHSAAIDEPIDFEDYSASTLAGTGSERSMYGDRQKSILLVTDTSNSIVLAAYQYGIFGEITQTQGSLAQPYGYTGRKYDVESGLYYYRARAYDPNVGKFLQVDPIEFASGTYSLYSYVSNQPTKYSDPSGLARAPVTQSDIFARTTEMESASNLAMMTHLSMGVIDAGARITDAMSNLSVEFFNKGGYIRITKPGRCTAAQHLALDKLVDGFRNPARCTAVPGNVKEMAVRSRLQMDNLNRMRQWSGLAVARHTLDATCYGGGGDHGGPKNDALDRMHDCLSIILYNNRTGRAR